MDHHPHAESLWTGQCEQQQTNKETIAAKGSVHHPPKEGRTEKDLPEEASQRELYERFIREDYLSDDDEVKDDCGEGQDKDGLLDEMTQRMNYENSVLTPRLSLGCKHGEGARNCAPYRTISE